uniref:Uncharacterized protein n=1 Tax=Borreliella afzelii TaxID=29518 RepID=Q5W293_BORAF|nr:hypothetical protein [Borreliella afzelii]
MNFDFCFSIFNPLIHTLLISSVCGHNRLLAMFQYHLQFAYSHLGLIYVRIQALTFLLESFRQL